MSKRRRSRRSGSDDLVIGALVLAVIGVATLIQMATGQPVEKEMWPITAIVGVIALILVARTLRQRPTPEISLGEFLTMSPSQFEKSVAGVLARYGYRLRVTGGAGDLAADLVGTDPDGHSVVVQCKRYAPGQYIGSPDIQKFIGMGRIHHAAKVLVFVTTSEYSAPARGLAGKHDVVLVSGNDLVRLTALSAPV